MEESDERVALVTGANRGLGREVARQLARRGYRVVVGSRNAAKAEATAAALGEELGDDTLLGRAIDVTDEEAAAACARWIGERFGRLDAVVNNAGVMADDARSPGVLDAEVQAFRRAFDTNTLGAFRVTRAHASLLQESRGCVVNVSSGMGGLTEMGGGYPAYRLSKAALNALTRVLHAELHPSGVRVNAICPGWVRTDMGGSNAPRDLPSGASGIVWAATLPPDGPSGGFFRDGRPIPW